MASDLNGKMLLGLEIATKRDIIGIALANMIVSANAYIFVLDYFLIDYRNIWSYKWSYYLLMIQVSLPKLPSSNLN